MTRTIKTYTLSERAMGPDFGIHDERSVTRIGEAHRHEYFQIQLNLAGETRQHIGATARPLEPGYLSFVLPYRTILSLANEAVCAYAQLLARVNSI